jgi:hypothetical protein
VPGQDLTMSTFNVKMNKVQSNMIEIKNSDEPDLTVSISFSDPKYGVWVHDLIRDGIKYREESYWRVRLGRLLRGSR